MVGATPAKERIASLTDRVNVAHSNASYWRGEATYWFDKTAEAHLVVRLGLAKALRDLRQTPEGRTYARMVLVHIQRERRLYRAAETEAAA